MLWCVCILSGTKSTKTINAPKLIGLLNQENFDMYEDISKCCRMYAFGHYLVLLGCKSF